ncbi:DUF2478 domain-containing protein [Paracoccus gahaiensis]|uniref:DUF2478 domain-containing protein n=1 Tax=Paracoccus gahaiensis TaxID=1706839 RepID=A0A4U0RBI8_9RHOB|nr:DUF2478 domain-containing protein [Paracoccus gahaiensis]TJZ92286.1 DUF2478 domain-containing protein [Paracoccus gahaiensis]
MLAWFSTDEGAAPGAADRLIEDLATDLRARGLAVAGAVQRNLDLGPDCACDMEIVVLGDPGAPLRISQSLGPGAQGCRLDTGALEEAVARTAPHLEGAGLVVIPKFGRQEAMGRGFRDLIGRAAAEGQPVLLYVPRQQQAAFLDFAGDLAVRLDPQALRDWCLDRFAVPS